MKKVRCNLKKFEKIFLKNFKKIWKKYFKKFAEKKLKNILKIPKNFGDFVFYGKIRTTDRIKAITGRIFLPLQTGARPACGFGRDFGHGRIAAGNDAGQDLSFGSSMTLPQGAAL